MSELERAITPKERVEHYLNKTTMTTPVLLYLILDKCIMHLEIVDTVAQYCIYFMCKTFDPWVDLWAIM